MLQITRPLREEHQELFPHIEFLRAVADMVGEIPTTALRHELDAAYDFLLHHLIPHAEAEDAALYPVVDEVMGAPEATATMRRDHVEIARLVRDLDRLRMQMGNDNLTDVQAKTLRRILYGLYTLIQVHFAKEEEIYLPLLDKHISPEKAHEIFEAMGAAAEEVKQLV